jgi:uncharacterized delta-60 repeat protein
MYRRVASLFIACLALLLTAAPAARATPGDLDPAFGGGGIVRTDLTSAEDDGFAVAIQTDGKIVVAGAAGIGGPNPRFGIVRYQTDGSLDPSFGGGDGKVSIDFTPRDDWPFAVRIQADGKILVAGAAAYGADSRFAVARLTMDGSLDPTFGGDGRVMTNLTPSYDWANGMALQPDGEIVLVGSVSAGSRNGKVGVLRYRSDGSLDPAFGGDGIVLADPTPTYDDGLAVGVEADGQIVVAGDAGYDGPKERFVALAFRSDGSLDPTFGGDGKVFTDLTPTGDDPFGLAIQGDGRIVVAGGAARGSPDPKFALVRYERDGSLDPSFGGDGTVITNVTPYDDGAYSVAIDPVGRIVAAGKAGNDGPAPRFATVRYLADGTLDAAFGGDGKITADVTPLGDTAWGVAVQADGSVVCSGVAGVGGPHASFAVLRYQP